MQARFLYGLCCGLFLLVNVSAASDEKRIGFTAPGTPWTLTMPADDFQIAEHQIRTDGKGAYFHLVDEKQNINLSMFIEPVKDCQTSKACRDMIWKIGNPTWEHPQNVAQSEIGDVSILELLVPKFRGEKINQQNMYAEFVVDGFWVDLHISKVLYKPEERPMFERIVKSIKFEPKKDPKVETEK